MRTAHPPTRALLLAALIALFGVSTGVSTGHAQLVVPDVARETTVSRTPFPDNFETSRGMAMGLGARASATSTSALAYNAAGLSIARLYHVETGVVYEPQQSRFVTNSALIDSQSGPVNMGAAFRYIHGNGDTGHGGFDGRVALGLPLGDNFAIGATGRYISFWREGQGEDTDVEPLVEQFTFDASIRVTPIPGLHIAALGYNLLPTPSPLAPMRVGGSMSYTIDNAFTLAVDGLADLSTWTDENDNIVPEGQFGGAAEYFTGEIPIRAGYFYDTGRDAHYFTAGAGWMNSEVGIDVAWRQQLNGEQLTWLLASIRYLVQ